MFYIVEVDGHVRQIIDTKGKANKYGEPKLFKSRKDAEAWILKHSYKGMSFHYEIKEIKEYHEG